MPDILDLVKKALRIKTDAYNNEIQSLISAALLDLGVAGVEPEDLDDLVFRAIITYVKMSFGLPEDYERLKQSYDEQKAQMSNATGYTNWEVE